MSNENCLAGMRCPTCKNEGPFWVKGTASFKVFDDGVDDYADVEWDEGASCVCPECGFGGVVDDFHTLGGEESNGL